jgi:ribosome recycling factor
VANAEIEKLKKDVARRMDAAVEVLQKELGGLRTGRASTSLLEPLVVHAYGTDMPMPQVATISAPEPRMLSVQVWDRGLIKAVEKAIQESGLGLNPVGEGQVIRVPIPTLTEERRHELGKVASRYAEEARVAVRNVRRHAMEELKKADKDGNISQDEHRDYSKQVQELTDQHIKRVDEVLAKKESEILQV